MSASESSTSPRTGSAPDPRSASAEVSDRASALTRLPSASSRSRIARPRKPVPPVTRTGLLALIAALRESRGKTGEVLDRRHHRDRGGGDHRPFVEPQRPELLPVMDDRQEDGDELDVRFELAPDRGREDGAVGGDDAAQGEDQQLAPDDDGRDPGGRPVDVDQRDQRARDEQLVG